MNTNLSLKVPTMMNNKQTYPYVILKPIQNFFFFNDMQARHINKDSTILFWFSGNDGINPQEYISNVATKIG